MEHTENILEPNKSLIPSLCNVLAMLQLRMFYDKNTKKNVVEAIAINCSNCNKDTGLYLKEIFHHVGMSWIICSNIEILYETEENDHPN